MSFRTRALIAFALAALVPLLVFGLGVRRELAGQLTAGYERRVEALVTVIESDLERTAESIGGRLGELRHALLADNRFRAAVLRERGREGVGERAYLLDYAGQAMRLTGLDMLQIQDAGGRIVSSGHFRNEYDRLEPDLPGLLAGAPGGLALVTARTPAEPFLALARVDSFTIAGQRFTLAGGVRVERDFLRGLARGDDLAVSLVYPGGALSSDPALQDRLAAAPLSPAQLAGGGNTLAGLVPGVVARSVSIAFVEPQPRGGARAVPARLLVTHPLTGLRALREGVDVWLATAVGVTALLALALAIWLSSRISRPLVALARKTEQIDLDRLDVSFDSERGDEIGTLARLLGAMTERLRSGAARLREAERRATIGDLARQVNHDIKNGLVPIRNVFRHLTQVEREEPERVAAVLAERRETLESSISYLEDLARNYARLSSPGERASVDVNDVVRQVLDHAGAGDAIRLEADLDERSPSIAGDPVALRRVLENLVGNAVESLDAAGGTVTVHTRRFDAEGSGPGVRIIVKDDGRGMTDAEAARIFEDFYTTKEDGSGLGLSIVRRLIMDLDGTIRVESEPGVGSRFIVELPPQERERSERETTAAREGR